MLEPAPVEGITWLFEGPEPNTFRVAARTLDGGDAARASLVLGERPGIEWRANLEILPEPHAPPALRGAIVAWAEDVTRQSLAGALMAGTPVLLCVDNSAPDDGAVDVLAAAGLSLAVAEDDMRRGLALLPAVALPPSVSLASWNEHSAPLFFHAYDAAFRDRPGFPNWDEARWRASFTSSEDFRADLSVVALDGFEPAAYAVIWAEGATGWVTQMGVRPEWRGNGLGEALLAHALHVFAADGLQAAALEVATNNPHARALYERMGFKVVRSHQSWRKSLT